MAKGLKKLVVSVSSQLNDNGYTIKIKDESIHCLKLNLDELVLVPLENGDGILSLSAEFVHSTTGVLLWKLCVLHGNQAVVAKFPNILKLGEANIPVVLREVLGNPRNQFVGYKIPKIVEQLKMLGLNVSAKIIDLESVVPTKLKNFHSIVKNEYNIKLDFQGSDSLDEKHVGELVVKTFFAKQIFLEHED